MGTVGTEACGCDDFDASRRTFLRGGAGLGGAVGISTVFGGVFSQAAFGAGVSGPSTLVVLSLRGGADGMSMVVPHGDTAYAPARPTIAVPAESLLERNSMYGLHPSFA
ncbi:MAG: hypothetical protein M3Q87_12545, partial [Actinomycetota bacterium]|nr:hypothetical protein [Actinomycetota bacterium]